MGGQGHLKNKRPLTRKKVFLKINPCLTDPTQNFNHVIIKNARKDFCKLITLQLRLCQQRGMNENPCHDFSQKGLKLEIGKLLFIKISNKKRIQNLRPLMPVRWLWPILRKYRVRLKSSVQCFKIELVYVGSGGIKQGKLRIPILIFICFQAWARI